MSETYHPFKLSNTHNSMSPLLCSRLLSVLLITTSPPPCVSPAHQSNRVTLKMDVSHTEHSHVIGKGGNNIKRVMEETGCHIHFPDSNRNNQAEKSNQVGFLAAAQLLHRCRAGGASCFLPSDQRGFFFFWVTDHSLLSPEPQHCATAVFSDGRVYRRAPFSTPTQVIFFSSSLGC